MPATGSKTGGDGPTAEAAQSGELARQVNLGSALNAFLSEFNAGSTAGPRTGPTPRPRNTPWPLPKDPEDRHVTRPKPALTAKADKAAGAVPNCAVGPRQAPAQADPVVIPAEFEAAPKGPAKPRTATVDLLARRVERPETPPPADQVKRPSSRKLVFGAIAVAAVTALVTSLAWGMSDGNSLSQRTHQLAAVQAQLASTKTQLVGTENLYNGLYRAHQQVMKEYSAAKAELTAEENKLGATEDALGETQSQLGQAQGKLGATQSALGQTKQSLTATEDRVAQCKTAASLGQQNSQLLATFIQVENVFMSAEKTGDAATMQTDVAQMQKLSNEVQATSPEFSSAVGLCTGI